jgi:Ca2+/Na+ antiporter
MDILILVGALVVILLGAEAFTNSLEHFGERLGISEGVTGSVFAAIGTALPETMVPLFAILLPCQHYPVAGVERFHAVHRQTDCPVLRHSG